MERKLQSLAQSMRSKRMKTITNLGRSKGGRAGIGLVIVESIYMVLWAYFLFFRPDGGKACCVLVNKNSFEGNSTAIMHHPDNCTAFEELRAEESAQRVR